MVLVTFSVGTVSSSRDSSVLGSALTHLWNFGLCLQAPWISSQELIKEPGFFLDCLSISSLSLAHSVQMGVGKVFTALIGFPSHKMLQLMLFLWRSGEMFLKLLNTSAKCLAHESNLWPVLLNVCTSPKCFCILFLKCCWVHPMYTFLVFLHSTLYTTSLCLQTSL